MSARSILFGLAGAVALSGCVVVQERKIVRTEPAPATLQTSSVFTPGTPGRANPLTEDFRGVSITRDVVYGHKDGMALVYDVIQPDNANGSAVLYMVSGGWFSRWAAPETRVAQFRPLLDAGITVIPVHHGSAPRFKVPEAHADVKRALRHVTLNAAEHRIDPARLGVWGQSAGGHLSLMLGLNGDDGDAAAQDVVLRAPARIKAVVAYFPPTDLRRMTGPNDRFPALDFPQAEAAAISPILFVDQADPPTLVIHGDADELVPLSSGQAIHTALKSAGAKTDLVIIEGGDHGFTNREHRARATQAMADWFKSHL